MNKTNFNQFIWFTGKLKKYIFFGWFFNSWIEKKQKRSGSRLGYCPFCTWSRYNALYCDTGRTTDAHRLPAAGMIQPREGTKRLAGLRYSLRHNQPRARACGSACAWPGHWGVCHDIIGCIVTGGGLASGCVTIQCYDTAGKAPLYGARGVRHDRGSSR